MNIKKTVFFRLKDNIIIRIFAYPFVNAKRWRANIAYVHADESKKIRILRNSQKGKRCFIIGNGPSLKVDDLENLDNEVTFASNRIYRIFDKTNWKPDYYVAFEPEFVTQNIDELLKIPVKKTLFLNNRAFRKNATNVYWINCTSKFCVKKETTKSILFSEDISKYIGDGYSVTYTMLQIAMYMGFSEIYLLGMDHNKNDTKTTHYYTDKKEDFRTPTFWDGIEYAYSKADKYAEKKGIKIVNITRGGELEVFHRKSINEVLKKYE